MTCKVVGLTMSDLEYMTIGDCLDYADEYISLKNGDTQNDSKNTVVKAKQSDFDSF